MKGFFVAKTHGLSYFYFKYLLREVLLFLFLTKSDGLAIIECDKHI